MSHPRVSASGLHLVFPTWTRNAFATFLWSPIEDAVRFDSDATKTMSGRGLLSGRNKAVDSMHNLSAVAYIFDKDFCELMAEDSYLKRKTSAPQCVFRMRWLA